MSALELSGVRAGYGRVEVLHGVDLRVPAGAAVALLGANGAGKSTLLRVASGLIRPSGGTVTLAGTDVTGRPAFRRARAGLCLIPEGRGILRQLSVRENIAMQVGGRGTAEALVAAGRRFPVLAERPGQEAGTLSGGQQQMLALARALVTDPQVILADELSVGLAPVLVDEIFAALAALKAEGRSLLIVEQYVDRALALADYVYILHRGDVVFEGEPTACGRGVFDRYMGGVTAS